MPTAVGQVATDRASRYLVQLCRHLGQMRQMRHRVPVRHGGQEPPAIERVDWSDTTGTIRFAQGMCTLRASDNALTLRVEADDEDTLGQLRQGITRRLDTIGRRDNLTVHWRQSTLADNPPPEGVSIDTVTPTNTERTRRTRRAGGLLAMVAIITVAILIHVGVLGATQAASAWASWGTNIILVIIAVKIITVVLHGVLGRAAFRHRGTVGRWIRGHRDGDTGQSHPRDHAA